MPNTPMPPTLEEAKNVLHSNASFFQTAIQHQQAFVLVYQRAGKMDVLKDYSDKLKAALKHGFVTIPGCVLGRLADPNIAQFPLAPGQSGLFLHQEQWYYKNKKGEITTIAITPENQDIAKELAAFLETAPQNQAVPLTPMMKRQITLFVKENLFDQQRSVIELWNQSQFTDACEAPSVRRFLVENAQHEALTIWQQRNTIPTQIVTPTTSPTLAACTKTLSDIEKDMTTRLQALNKTVARTPFLSGAAKRIEDTTLQRPYYAPYEHMQQQCDQLKAKIAAIAHAPHPENSEQQAAQLRSQLSAYQKACALTLKHCVNTMDKVIPIMSQVGASLPQTSQQLDDIYQTLSEKYTQYLNGTITEKALETSNKSALSKISFIQGQLTWLSYYGPLNTIKQMLRDAPSTSDSTTYEYLSAQINSAQDAYLQGTLQHPQFVELIGALQPLAQQHQDRTMMNAMTTVLNQKGTFPQTTTALLSLKNAQNNALFAYREGNLSFTALQGFMKQVSDEIHCFATRIADLEQMSSLSPEKADEYLVERTISPTSTSSKISPTHCAITPPTLRGP